MTDVSALRASLAAAESERDALRARASLPVIASCKVCPEIGYAEGGKYECCHFDLAGSPPFYVDGLSDDPPPSTCPIRLRSRPHG